jgi:hypothetical protein
MSKAKPEDLINKVIAADALRRQARGERRARFKPSQRVWIEPFFNLLGLLWGQITLLLPWPLHKPYVQWVVHQMGGHTPIENPELPRRMEETVRLARDLKAKTGQWPALLVLMSHPETEGPLEWLRFEIMCQGLQVADAVIEARAPGSLYPGHPRCLLAIDPYALDTVSPAVAGFYAAWMSRIYLAYDRQPSTQSLIQKHLLLRKTDYTRIAWKLLWHLKKDTPVLMALGGGLPFNARLLYSAREFVQRLRPARWNVSKRTAQIELMEILMMPEELAPPAQAGELPQAKQQAIREALIRWGLPSQEAEGRVREFVEEFKLPVPYRARLFRVLGRRLVARGKPLILLPISHHDTPPYIQIASPVAIEKTTEDIESFGRILAKIFAESA